MSQSPSFVRMFARVVVGISVIGCGSDPSPGGSSASDGGTPQGGQGGGGLVCETEGDTCTCKWSSTAGSTHEPCFASRAPGSVSNNVCCTNGKPVGAGYECTCAPPVAGSWSCFVVAAKTSCDCYGDPSRAPLNSTAVDPSECIPKNGGKCGYNSGADNCECLFSSSVSLAPRFSPVATCASRPGNFTVRTCANGTVETSSSTPSACDGDCHGETCFGSAAEECDATGCYKRQYVCDGRNRCITIPAN